MLFETYDPGVDPRTVHLFFGLALGALFGIAAQISRFCLRRAVAGPRPERRAAAGVWLTGLAMAMLATQSATLLGFVALEDHRWLSSKLPLAALVLGGLAFGGGMVLTRGCVSRLTVLGASGNLRALTVLLVFALVAHAMMKGVLSPLRAAVTAITVDSPVATLAELPGGAGLWTGLIALPLLFFALRSGARAVPLALGGAIGLIAALGWSGSSVLLFDAFDPLSVQSIAFTLPWADSLFWSLASTAIAPSFGVGFVGGVLAGAAASALVRREARLESFESPAQTLRYALGALLMGIGGVLAAGCTVGAGLAGGGTLSVAALIALGAIVIGAKVAHVLDHTALLRSAQPAH